MVPPESQGLGGGTIILLLEVELDLALSPVISKVEVLAAVRFDDVVEELPASSPPKNCVIIK